MYVCHAEMNAIMNKISANVEGKLLYTFRYKVWCQIIMIAALSQWYSLYDFDIPFRLFHVCRSFSMQRMHEDDFAVRNQRDRLFQVLS